MPDDNVEIVRRILETWRRGESPAAEGLLDEQVEWVNAPEAVEPGTRRGIRAFEAAAASVVESFENVRLEVDELIPSGDRVLMLGTIVVRGRESSAELRQRVAQLWTLRQGRALRVELLLDPERARAALDSKRSPETSAPTAGDQAATGNS
ncbi:MAG: nuclear transport factor 2 family protein [Solirubrobacteraceae bacterium]